MYVGGATVNVQATPATGWELNYWLLNGTNVGSATVQCGYDSEPQLDGRVH